MDNVQVHATSSRNIERVVLLPNIRTVVPELCEMGFLIWSPPANAHYTKVQTETESKRETIRVPAELPIDWTFVCDWAPSNSCCGGSAVAVYDQEVYISLELKDTVDVYAIDGTFARRLTPVQEGNNRLSSPTALAVYADEVYICNTGRNEITVCGIDGTWHRNFDSPILMYPDHPITMCNPSDLAIQNREVYVLDTDNERIQVFGTDGTFHRMWDNKKNCEMDSNQIVVVDDEVLVLNSAHFATDLNFTVTIYTLAGEFVREFEPDFCPVSGLAVHGNRVYYCSTDDMRTGQICWHERHEDSVVHSVPMKYYERRNIGRTIAIEENVMCVLSGFGLVSIYKA
jgi:hypothetical protein